MSHFIYWSKICHILLLVENMSHFITGRKYVPFYFWSKICPLLYWSKKCPSKKCPSKKRPSKKRPGALLLIRELVHFKRLFTTLSFLYGSSVIFPLIYQSLVFRGAKNAKSCSVGSNIKFLCRSYQGKWSQIVWS